jgi:glycosyltransferase involved in cell wall biosynthesis
MKVVFLAYNFLPEYRSPAEWLRRIRPFTGAMEVLAGKCEVFYMARINFDGEYLHGGVKCWFIKPRGSVYFPRRLHAFLKHISPDIIIIPGFHFPLQILQLRKALGKKVKIIIEYHADRPSRGPGRFLQKMADRAINAYQFTSVEDARPWLESSIIKDASKCIEIAVGSTGFRRKNKNLCRSRLGLGNGLYFLSVGRLNANKDPFTLLKGVENYLRANQGSRLVMIYQESDMLVEIRSFIAQRPHLENSVVLRGHVPHEELEDWYSACDFFISASLSEGGSIALLEAMACGCIPIVSSIPSALTVTGPEALQFKAGDAGELARILTRIDKDTIPELSDAVEKRFTSLYSFEAIAEKLYHSFSLLTGK